MKTTIRAFKDNDAPRLLEIFNYFVRNSFAAYGDKDAGPEVLEKFKNMKIVFLVLEVEEEAVGFGLVQKYRPHDTMRHTGMLTYFVLPEYTGKGLGSRLFNRLLEGARAKGVTNFVAHISSLNEQSLRFHKKQGFQECGRLKNMGIKFNRPFDIIWVQLPGPGGAPSL